MNDITSRQNFDIAALNSLASDIVSVSQSISSTSTEPFLRMGRDGEWVYGTEPTEVEEGSQWAIHPQSLKHGYVCWSSGDDPTRPNTKLGEEMVRAGQPKPLVTALPNLGYEWKEQVAFTLACISGTDKGLQVQYSVSSIGGLNELKRLTSTMGQRISAEAANGGLNPDKSEIVPIVALDHSSYMHKTRKTKIYTPVFNVLRWTTLNDSGPKPSAPVAAAAPKPQPAQPQEEDAPRRRRSRG